MSTEAEDWAMLTRWQKVRIRNMWWTDPIQRWWLDWPMRLAWWLPRGVALWAFIRVYSAGVDSPGPEYEQAYKSWEANQPRPPAPAVPLGATIAQQGVIETIPLPNLPRSYEGPLVTRARDAVRALRDATREGRTLDFRERDPLVGAIHDALDLLQLQSTIAWEGLQSIAGNACCESCREAALVAQRTMQAMAATRGR